MPRNVFPETIRLLLTVAVCLSCTSAPAQNNVDADTREVLAYTLTEAGLAKYSQATRNLAALPDGAPGACDDETGEGSIAEMVAALNAWPGGANAIRSAGLTTREYIVFTWSLLHNAMAGWAASEPGGSLPAGVSRANVDFVKKHEADLQQLGASAGSDDCDDAYDEEEFGEDNYEEEGP
jgi:hypothetical protein